MKIKRIASLLQAVVLCVLCGAVWALATEQGYGVHTIGEDHLFWVTHYNDGTVEGAGTVFTREDTAGGWWLHVGFAPTIASRPRTANTRTLSSPVSGVVGAISLISSQV